VRSRNICSLGDGLWRELTSDAVPNKGRNVYRLPLGIPGDVLLSALGDGPELTAEIMTRLSEKPTDWNDVNQNATRRPHGEVFGA
jgi:hypothetical protein